MSRPVPSPPLPAPSSSSSCCTPCGTGSAVSWPTWCWRYSAWGCCGARCAAPPQHSPPAHHHTNKHHTPHRGTPRVDRPTTGGSRTGLACLGVCLVDEGGGDMAEFPSTIAPPGVSRRCFPTQVSDAGHLGKWGLSASVGIRGLFDGDAYRSTIRKTQLLPWGWCLVCTAGNSASLAQRHPDRSGRLAGARSRCCAPSVPARSSRPPPVVCFSRPPDFVKGGCPCGGRGPMSARQLFRDRASSGSVPAGVPENFSR